MTLEVPSGKLSDLVQYQDGAIVSKTILDKKTGNVTVFAFDKDQKLSEHTAPFDALVYVLDGECEIRISNKPYRLRAGEFVVMPANEPHAVNAVEKFKMVLVMIKS
ncbi:cupin domain-containing protein [Thermotoga caldifontis]|uniref:cupin domain-containing protein n=1 Tax=Thermotoga caldifontis TaxID=1508419 RepID=UPI000596E193|nr:cupin domain-containing protein [Thermotoga caldifontis]